MRTDIAYEGDVAIASVEGRLDATTAAAFEEAVSPLPKLDPPKSLVVDLKGLQFISSAGLRSILSLGKACRASGASLAFCSLSDMVADVFKISGFMTIFKIYPSREEAMAALAEAAK